MLPLAVPYAPAAATRPPDYGIARLGDDRSTLPGTGATITWLGAAADSRWSNPANWDGGRIPGPSDVARFAASSRDAVVDPGFAGLVGGLVLEEGYAGRLRLAGVLRINGDLLMAGGTLAGGDAALWIEGAARVSGGLLTTPGATMRVSSLEIRAPGVVRMGLNGKLNLAGDGVPLTGDGTLDTQTNRPNRVEYTGHATEDLTAAGPLLARRTVGLSSGGQKASPGRGPEMGGQDSPLARSNLFESGSLRLSQREGKLASAVIDSTHGFAYFGAETSPGIVVKVRLSDFSRVGALTLNAEETELYSAVIDTQRGSAYFGTLTRPGRVVEVRLSDFSRAGGLAFGEGEDSIWCAVIDPTRGNAYFGLDTGPGIVVRVSLAGAGYKLFLPLAVR